MIKSVRVVSLLLPVVSAIALIVIFSAYNPVEIGPLGVLFVFGLMYLFWASLLFTALHGGVSLWARLVSRSNKPVRFNRWRIGVRRAYYIASVVAFGPVMLLALNSVGELKVQDILLVGVLLVLATFYIIKRS